MARTVDQAAHAGRRTQFLDAAEILLRTKGYSVAERPVNHRPRLRGVSKYGVHNRLWRGIRDCFGVRWYLARAVRSNRL